MEVLSHVMGGVKRGAVGGRLLGLVVPESLPMDYRHLVENQLRGLREQHRYRELTVLEGLCFIHNDYLGISDHPKILEAAEWGARIFGAGSRGSRLLGGNSRIFLETEEKIAEFFAAPASLFFSSGYLANISAIQVLSELTTHIISDRKNHASLIDGIRLSGKEKFIVEHRRWDEVPKEALKEPALLVSESLFSMDGDLQNLSEIQRMQESSGSFLVLDEAHAAGVFKQEGRGLLDKGDLDWDRTVVMVSFGKAFGVGGAALLCSQLVRELLINRARTFIYTTAPPPAVPAMVGAATEVLSEEGWRREELWSRAEKVRRILRQANEFTPESGPVAEEGSSWEERSPIIPFLIPGDRRALRFSESMRKLGVGIKPIRYPSVPRGTERIRLSLDLRVSRDNTEWMAHEMVKQWKEFLLQEPIPR